MIGVPTPESVSLAVAKVDSTVIWSAAGRVSGRRIGVASGRGVGVYFCDDIVKLLAAGTAIGNVISIIAQAPWGSAARALTRESLTHAAKGMGHGREATDSFSEPL